MKRVLVLISISFSVRYLYRSGLLAHLKKICHPVVVITWNQEDLVKELKEDGYEVHLIEPPSTSVHYQNLRRKINIWFDYYRMKSASKKLHQQYERTFNQTNKRRLKDLSRLFNRLKLFFPFYQKKLLKDEERLLVSEANFKTITEIIKQLQIDAVFTVTPFHQQEDLLLRVCRFQNKLMITSILSFDNITKRGWIPVNYDVYMVWNKYNFAELNVIYPESKKSRNVCITGAPQFDFYFQNSFRLSEEEWRRTIGINRSYTKIILYAGGPATILPNETQYLVHLAQAIREGLIPKNTCILFRCHPVDKIKRWKNALSEIEHVYFEEAWSGEIDLKNANITERDICQLCSTLAYSDVHVNFCSTMTVDGSAFRKPQIGPYYDDVDKKNEVLLRRLYHQDHFLPILNTGGLALADSKEKLIALVNQALSNPIPFIQKSDQILKEIITFTDGLSTQRVVNVIKNSLDRL